MRTTILNKAQWKGLTPAERFDELAAMHEFGVVKEFLTNYGRDVLTDGEHDVIRHWSVSVVPQTRMTQNGIEFRPFTLNVGPMETAFMLVTGADTPERRRLFGCVYVARAAFLVATGRTIEQLLADHPLLDFDPNVKFKSAKGDALRIYWDATDSGSATALNVLPWQESAVVLVNRLRTLPLAPGRMKAHSPALANLLLV